MRSTLRFPLAPLSAVFFLAGAVHAQSPFSGSTGVDGALEPEGDLVIDLAVEGTYDPALWAVVFHYTSIDIPDGVRISFTNHPSRAPVVWLSQNDVYIGGEIDLDGAPGHIAFEAPTSAEPGPGGFRGGRGAIDDGSWISSSGFGPGGGFQSDADAEHGGSGASHATAGEVGEDGGGPTGALYGDPPLFQLVGGSGGSGGRYGQVGQPTGGGGAGGGAILIVAEQEVFLGEQAYITANGGTGGPGPFLGGTGLQYGGGGSGGAIRIVAGGSLTLSGAGEGGPGPVLEARAGSGFGGGGPGGGSGGTDGGYGRIRLEASSFDLAVPTNPVASTGAPGPIFPPLTFPTIRIAQVGAMAAPVDPNAGLGANGEAADLSLTTAGLTTVTLETAQLPLDSQLFLRVTRAHGAAFEVPVTNALSVIGPGLAAQTTVDVDLSGGYAALQARAVLP